MGSNQLRDIIFYQVLKNMQDKDFYVVNADFTGRPFLEMAEKYPDHFIQTGIMEQNMVAVACGLALAGKRAVTYSPNPFVYLRAYDQIRNAVCMMGLPVTIVANGMGLVNPGLGATHFVTEDYQLFSLLPNMQILTVSDEAVARLAAGRLLEGFGTPAYLRIDFDCDGTLPSQEEPDFAKGFRMIRRGGENLVVTQGYGVRTALSTEFARPTAIMDIFRRPYDIQALLEELANYETIVVLEEQQLRGGLGSEMLEICSQNQVAVKIRRLGISYQGALPQEFGKRAYWMRRYGIDSMALKQAVETP